MLGRRRFLLAGVALVAGCRRRRLSPEQQIRSVLSALETAIEDKHIDDVRRLIADTFTSDEAPDRAAAIGLLGAVVARFPHIHLLTRVTSIDFPTPRDAHARVTAAAAAHHLNGPDDLSRISADVLVFDLSLAEASPGAWQVTAAAWRGGEPQDFLDQAHDRN